MDYGIYDIFDGLYSYFIDVFAQFRRFLFTTGAGEIRNFKYFFFAGIPILFASFEAIFDYLLPTFFDLRPMGIKRFLSMRFDRFKPIEAKSFNIRFNSNYRSVRSSFFRSRFNSVKFTPEEEKLYNLLYQRKYNTTATPLELKRFYYSELKGAKYPELKHYAFYPSNTSFNNRGLKKSMEGIYDFGHSVYYWGNYLHGKLDKNNPDNYPDQNLTKDLEYGSGGTSDEGSKRSYHPNED